MSGETNQQEQKDAVEMQQDNTLLSAINEIKNAMERWHLWRANNDETLDEINKILVGIGRLEWFNITDKII